MRRSRSEARNKANASQLKSIYRCHIERIYSLCLRLLGDAREAELATAEAFLQFGGDSGRQRDETRTQMYLREMAIDTSLAHLAEHHARDNSVEISSPRIPFPPNSASHESPPRLEPALLDSLIGRLPDPERAVYVLHDVEGVSDASVAVHLQISEAETRRYLRNARLELRRLWRSQ